MSTFGDILTGVLLQRTIGQGSQDSVQQADLTKPADQAVHARNPMRAARALTLVRVTIY
jgi:hypothetical protein